MISFSKSFISRNPVFALEMIQTLMGSGGCMKCVTSGRNPVFALEMIQTFPKIKPAWSTPKVAIQYSPWR